MTLSCNEATISQPDTLQKIKEWRDNFERKMAEMRRLRYEQQFKTEIFKATKE